MIESKNDDKIMLKVNMDLLHKSLKSGQDSANVLLKLTKRDDEAYLCITFDGVMVFFWFFFGDVVE